MTDEENTLNEYITATDKLCELILTNMPFSRDGLIAVNNVNKLRPAAWRAVNA